MQDQHSNNKYLLNGDTGGNLNFQKSLSDSRSRSPLQVVSEIFERQSWVDNPIRNQLATPIDKDSNDAIEKQTLKTLLVA